MQVSKQNKLQDAPTENAPSTEPQDLLDYNLSLTPKTDF